MISFTLDDSLRKILSIAERPDVPAVGGDLFIYAEARLPVKNSIRHVGAMYNTEYPIEATSRSQVPQDV